MRSKETPGGLHTVQNRPLLTYAAVFLCALYETMLLTWLLLAPHVANRTLGLVMATTRWGTPLFMAIIVLTLAMLCLRQRWPTRTLLVISVCMVMVSAIYGSAYIYLLLIWIVSLYSATVKTQRIATLIITLSGTGLMGLISVALATLWHQDTTFTGLLYPTLLCFVLCVGLGAISRVRKERRLSEQALLNERDRSLHLAKQRNEAVRQSRIAAELHDSVGHDLTAIIALSEGLEKSTGQPEIDDAIAMINDLARQGLNDTRTAVKAIQPTATTDDTLPLSEERKHTWDDIEQILSHARQIGITAALTETGRRPQDPKQADLSFTVTREAITNTIRHGQAVDRIVVSWDHDHCGGITITVRDNGRQTLKASNGTGLDRIRHVVQSCGGTFESGPRDTGWILRASIPSLTGLPADKEQE